MTSWAQEEFKTLELADARLEARAVRLAEQLAQSPGASLPQACGDWGQMQAAYRFLANEKTSAEAVLEAHAQANMARIGAQEGCCACKTQRSWSLTGKAQRVWVG